MSTWMILAPCAKPSTLPVTRSSKREPERDEQVGLLHRGDRGVVAVHAGHAEAQLVVVGERAARHERGDHREAGELDELAQRLGGAGLQDAAAGVDHRALRLAHEPGRVLDLLGVALRGRLVAGQVDASGQYQFIVWLATSFGMSMSTGPGRPVVATWNASRTTRGMSSASVISQLCLVIGIVMPTVSHSWNASVPITAYGTWPGDHHERDAVHVRVAQRRDDVRGRRTARDHGHAGAAGRVRVALGHVAGALLVAHEDVADRRVDQRVVDGEDGAARGGRT